jgi:hypothetical protein
MPLLRYDYIRMVYTTLVSFHEVLTIWGEKLRKNGEEKKGSSQAWVRLVLGLD